MSRIHHRSNTAAVIAPSLPKHLQARATPPAAKASPPVDSFSAAKAPAVAPVDPSFLPAGFDMNAAVDGLRKLLVAQGVPESMLQPGAVKHTVMTDFDGTLGRSAHVPVFLRAKADVVGPDGKVTMKAGAYFQDEKGNDLMLHGLTGADVRKDLAALQAKYPNLPWAQVTQDWHAFDDRALALRTPLEGSMVRMLENAAPQTALLVITNRTTQDVAGGIRENVLHATAGRLAVTGVLTTGSAEVQKALGIDSPALSDGRRKAIAQIVALELFGPGVTSHRYYDDSVSNDAPAITALAAKFTGMDVKVFEADHTLDNHAVPKLVAKSNGRGGFVDPRDGSTWTPEKVDAFAKSDPQPLLPQLTPAVAGR